VGITDFWYYCISAAAAAAAPTPQGCSELLHNHSVDLFSSGPSATELWHR